MHIIVSRARMSTCTPTEWTHSQSSAKKSHLYEVPKLSHPETLSHPESPSVTSSQFLVTVPTVTSIFIDSMMTPIPVTPPPDPKVHDPTL